MVLDASVIIKAFKSEEEFHEKAIDLLTANAGEIFEPDIIYYEFGNYLATKTAVLQKQIKVQMDLIYDIGWRVVQIDMDLMTQATLLAKQYNTALFDMVYAIIAREKGVKLITADRKFRDKTQFTWIRLLGEDKV